MAIYITVGRRGLVRNQDPHRPGKTPDERQCVPQSHVLQVQLPRVLFREAESVGWWGDSGSQMDLVLQGPYGSAEEPLAWLELTRQGWGIRGMQT